MATIPPLTMQPVCQSVVKATVTKAKRLIKTLSIRVLDIPLHTIHINFIHNPGYTATNSMSNIKNAFFHLFGAPQNKNNLSGYY